MVHESGGFPNFLARLRYFLEISRFILPENRLVILTNYVPFIFVEGLKFIGVPAAILTGRMREI